MRNINNKRESHNDYFLTNLNPVSHSRLVPVRRFAMWTEARFLLCVSRNPFMVASATFPGPNSFLYLWHGDNILPKIMLRQVKYNCTLYNIYDNISAVRKQTAEGKIMSEREQKALVIAAKSKLTKKGNTWLVPSQSDSDGRYKVNVTDPDWPTCTCPDFELRRARCKHIYAVEIVIEREHSTTTTTKKTSDGVETTTTVTETVKLRYKQVWSAYNTAQVNEKARFLVLLHELCSGIDEPIQHMGRTKPSCTRLAHSGSFE